MATRKARFLKGVMRRRRRAKLATVATVKKMIQKNEDKKAVDVAIDDNTPGAGASVVTLLTGVAQGDTDATREGDEIRLKSIHVRGTITNYEANIATACTCRLILVRWLDQTLGVNAAIGDILNSDSVNAFRYRDFQRSYQVVWDKTYVLPPTEVAQAGHKRRVDIYKSWKTPRRVDFTGSGATIAATGKGHYFLIRMVDDGTSDTTAPEWDMNVRCTYTG